MSHNVVNLHRRQTPNIGDLMSAPLAYFQIAENQRLLEFHGLSSMDEGFRRRWLAAVEGSDGIVLGGGGMMEFEKCVPVLEYVKKTGKKSAIWGTGTNASAASWTNIKPQFRYDYSGLGPIGCRDYNYEYRGFEWVPCASCMHEVFEQKIEVTRDIVFFGNAGMKGYTDFIPAGFPDDAIMLNLKTSIEAVAEFLGSAETVITSSYHGAYWATLLGRKVVGIPTSSKFYGFRHAIPLCTIDDWPRYAKLARTYPEALEECRAANIAFADKVKDYFFG